MKVEQKLKREAIKEKVTFVAGVIIILCLLVSLVLNVVNKRETEEILAIQDTTFLAYEESAIVAKKVQLLYEIYNDETYQKAKTNFPCDTVLYERLFSAEKYSKGNMYYKAPTVDIMQIQYVLNENEGDELYKYMIDLNITNNDNGTNSYVTCIVEVYQGVIYSLEVF